MNEQCKMFWNDMWERGSIPWDRRFVNQFLVNSINKLINGTSPNGKSILIPLSGKSFDILWLYERGFSVVGVELSPIGCESFFTDSNLDFTVEQLSPELKMYTHDERLKMIQGDILQLNPELIGGMKFDYVWDCNAISAMEYDMQDQYQRTIRSLLTDSARGLICAYDFDPALKSCPRAMTKEVMTKLFEGYTLELLQKLPSTECGPTMKSFGIGDFVVVYLYECR